MARRAARRPRARASRGQPEPLRILAALAPPVAAGLGELEDAALAPGALSARDKHLISLAVHAARRDVDGAIRHVRAARAAGADVADVLEVLLPTLLSHGPRAWAVGVEAAKRAGLPLPARRRHGREGASLDAGAVAAYYHAEFGREPEWVALMAATRPAYLAGYTGMRRAILADGRLPRKIKELVIVAAHAADRLASGVAFHVRGAQACGATDEEIAETFVLAAFAAGVPGWFEALAHLPLRPRASTVTNSKQGGMER